MAVPLIYVTHYDSATGKTDSVNDIISFTGKKGGEAKGSLLTFNLRNPTEKHVRTPTSETVFKRGDILSVYLGYTSSVLTGNINQLFMEGEIASFRTREQDSQRFLEVKCNDRTYTMLNRLWGKNHQNQSPPQIIKEVINSIKNAGDNIAITAALTTDTPAGYIQATATKPDGTYAAFDVSSIGYNFKPVYEIVRDTSQIEMLTYNGGTKSDRPYIFWVDTSRNFHWQYPSQSASLTLTEGTDPIKSIELEKSITDEVNYVIFSCGTDKNGVGILNYYINAASEASELKSAQKQSYDFISRDLIQQNGGTGSTWYTGISNSDFRTLCITEGKKKAQDLVFGRGQARWKGNINIRGTNTYQPRDLIKVTAPSYGLYEQLLRVNDITHQVNKSSWTTTLNLEEDTVAQT